MDAEGGGHDAHREWRISRRKLAIVLAVQNALVAACLLVSLYVFWIVQNQEPVDQEMENVHIKCTISSKLGNGMLRCDHIDSMNLMNLADEKKQKINVTCTGPYVLYIDVCYKSLINASVGTLQLQVEGNRRKENVSSFTLQAAPRAVCRGLHSVAFLRTEEQASLHLYSGEAFLMNIMNMTVGLSLLLGTEGKCQVY